MNSNDFLAQLISLPAVDHALLSPDGRWVAFNWYRIHENMDVYLVPADGSAPPVALTHTSEFTELESWNSDSRAVIVSEDHDRDEHTRLFLVELGDRRDVLHRRPPAILYQRRLSLPTGDSLYYGANFDFAQDRCWAAGLPPRLDSGVRTPLACPAKPGY
jgi:hypothetical protein